jgi:hypothetical protein
MSEDTKTLQFVIDGLKHEKKIWNETHGDALKTKYLIMDPVVNEYIQKIDKALELLERLKSTLYIYSPGIVPPLMKCGNKCKRNKRRERIIC